MIAFVWGFFLGSLAFSALALFLLRRLALRQRSAVAALLTIADEADGDVILIGITRGQTLEELEAERARLGL